MLKTILQTLPGICFTLSDLTELNDIIISKNIHEFSIDTYLIFIFVNLAGFIYTNKLYDIKSISAWIFPALIEISMILISIWKQSPSIFYLSLIGWIIFMLIYVYIVYIIKLPTKQFYIIPSILASLEEFAQLL